MRIAREEIFGPVLSVLTFDTPEEAARIANATPFGLSAGVWTRDLDTAIGMSRRIRAGHDLGQHVPGLLAPSCPSAATGKRYRSRVRAVSVECLHRAEVGADAPRPADVVVDAASLGADSK
jgi:hypothetical protein